MVDRQTEIKVICRTCNKEYEINANTQDLIDWQDGKHIQNAMPYVPADLRELLISGICGNCFKKMFKENS